jgi:hypothetical protein
MAIMSGSTIERAKYRALELLDRGDLHQAVASIATDINRYPDLAVPPEVTYVGIDAAYNRDAAGVRAFIEGFPSD